MSRIDRYRLALTVALVPVALALMQWEAIAGTLVLRR